MLMHGHSHASKRRLFGAGRGVGAYAVGPAALQAFASSDPEASSFSAPPNLAAHEHMVYTLLLLRFALCSCVFRLCSCVLLCAPAFYTVLLRFALFHTVLLRFALGSCDVRSRFTLQTYVQQYIVLYDRVSRTFSLCSSISHWAPAFRSVLLRFTLCS